VYLTFVGGGVFGNDMEWILAAIARAIVSVELANAALNVKICHYKEINPAVITRFHELYTSHKRSVLMHELCREEEECVPYQWIEGDSLAPPCQSDKLVVQGVIDFCNFVKSTDIVYDIGCGDGRIPLTMSTYYSCKSYGVEIEQQLIERFHQNIARMSKLEKKLSDLVTPIHADLRDIDLSNATVLIIYLLPEVRCLLTHYYSLLLTYSLIQQAIESIKEQLIALLTNGCVIICNTWGIKDLVAIETKNCGYYGNVKLHKYTKESLR
jgi:hypothetical protein